MSELPPDEPFIAAAGAARTAELAGGGTDPIAAPPDVPSAANDNLIDRTVAVWQPRSRRELRREDARQIVENVTGFFRILSDWSRVEIPTPANDTAKPLTSDKKEVRDDR
jgi:hypothetical protein